MVKQMTSGAFQAGKLAVSAADWSAGFALQGVRQLLSASLSWGAAGLRAAAAAAEAAPGAAGLADAAEKAAQSLQQAHDSADAGLSRAIQTVGLSMRRALDAVEGADGALHRALFEDIRVSSILGRSFGGITEVSSIEASFRLAGRDVSIDELVADFQRSALPSAAICVPGLFCDETLWDGEAGAGAANASLSDEMRQAGYYPLMLRFNPGLHISENGAHLLRLMESLLQSETFRTQQLIAITYSQGGLILRSALLQSRKDGRNLHQRLQRALLAASPDGGSYIEKIGFWLGMALGAVPAPGMQAVAWVADQRSDGIKDLSHGIIRQEDWQEGGQLERYGAQRYFGELDEIDAYQVYSLTAAKGELWTAWWGDGICEEASLKAISDLAYRKRADGIERVTVLYGVSHFQLLGSEGYLQCLRRFLKSKSA
ncbi:MAG: alpha/beta hydrolase [Leptospirales bacterium]|nr:alpha/beta hydrolase [Leptospirales bacterium]